MNKGLAGKDADPRRGGGPEQATPMRVAFDANCIYTTQAGTARYTKGLLSGIEALAPGHVLLHPLAWPVENLGYGQPVRALRTAYRELLWCRMRAYVEMTRFGADLLHSTSHLGFRMPPGVKRVHTLYDLAVLRYPWKFRPWQRRAGLRFLKTLPTMDRILCISRFTADEAMHLLALPANKLEVVYCGSDLAAGSHETETSLSSGICIPDTFFLFVGSLEPGKNLELLKAVYRLASDNGTPLPRLLIVGARWAGVAHEGCPPADWSYLGRVPDCTLVALYQRARALVFPSKYEGFGLPVLEAMSLGCPVLCSRSGSLPEVGGEAVYYCEQTPAAYLNGMQAVLSDDPLRDALRQRGRERALRFSWKRCAAETVAVYDDVLNRR